MKLSKADKALLKQKLNATSTDVGDALDDLPDDWKTGQIISTYDLGTMANPKPIKCSFRGKHPHGHGALVRSASGSVFRAGIDCAAREFGQIDSALGTIGNWASIERNFKHKQERQRVLRLLVEMGPCLDEALKHIRSDSVSGGLSFIEVSIKEFLDRFESLSRQLRSGNFPVKLRVEDKEAMDEERRAYQSKVDAVEKLFSEDKIVQTDRDGRLKALQKQRKLKTRYRTETGNYLQIHSIRYDPSVLLHYKKRMKRIATEHMELSKDFVAYREIDTSKENTTNLKTFYSKVIGHAKSLTDSFLLFSDFENYFSAGNLIFLVGWSRDSSVDCEISLREGSIFYSDQYFTEKMQLPKVDAIDMRPFQALASIGKS